MHWVVEGERESQRPLVSAPPEDWVINVTLWLPSPALLSTHFLLFSHRLTHSMSPTYGSSRSPHTFCCSLTDWLTQCLPLTEVQGLLTPPQSKYITLTFSVNESFPHDTSKMKLTLLHVFTHPFKLFLSLSVYISLSTKWLTLSHNHSHSILPLFLPTQHFSHQFSGSVGFSVYSLHLHQNKCALLLLPHTLLLLLNQCLSPTASIISLKP